MASMTIKLPDPMRDYVQHRISSGRYASASDYVRDLIRRDQGDVAGEGWLQALDASLADSLAEMQAGGGQDLQAVCDAVLAELEATGDQPRR